MIALTAQQTRDLAHQLLSAADHLREHAANHAVRAKAHRAVGDQIMRLYHREHAEALHTEADALMRSADALKRAPQRGRATGHPDL